MARFQQRSWWIVPAAASLLLGLLACGGGDGDGGTGPGGGIGTAIGPAGGTVTSSDGGAELVVPAGALAQEVDITVAAASAPPAGALDGTTYDCGPTGTTFAVPAWLEIGYDPAVLAPGTVAARLRLYTVASDVWVPVLGSRVDSLAHTVGAPLAHFSTYGVRAAGPAAGAEAHLLDTPDPGAPDEFDNLAAAMAWLQSQLDYEDEGVLHWRTDTPQEVANLGFNFDLVVEVEAGRAPVLRAAGGGVLTIDAVGAVDLSAFTIEASSLVLNANRSLNLTGCTLPAATVNIGGVAGAPFPAANPGYAAKSKRATKAAVGASLVGNVFANSVVFNLQGGGSVNGNYTLQDNVAPSLTVGGSAALDLGKMKICVTPAAPMPIPIPYPNIASRLGGTGELEVSGLKNVTKLTVAPMIMGQNRVVLRSNSGDEAAVSPSGMGTLTMSVVRSKVDFHVWSLDVDKAHVTVDSLEAETVKVTGGSSTKAIGEITLQLVEPQVSDLFELDFTQDTGATILVSLTDPDLQGGFHCFVPEGGDVTLDVQGGSVSGGSLWVGPNQVRKSGWKGLPAATGAITFTELDWSGSGTEHVEIWKQQVPVTITDCTFSYSGDPALPLGLTEIGGAMSITGNTLTNVGLGIVDATAAATVEDNDISLSASAGYGISLGASAAVTISGCTINAGSGSASGITTGAMNGDVTITGCTIVAPTLALLAAECDVTADDNSRVTGLVSVVNGSLHFSGNTCSGVQIIDDYVSPGLQNDPVADNDGVLPGMVMTRMDWDGNGCCDYPPEWNVQDTHGACAVCTGVGGKAVGR